MNARCRRPTKRVSRWDIDSQVRDLRDKLAVALPGLSVTIAAIIEKLTVFFAYAVLRIAISAWFPVASGD